VAPGAHRRQGREERDGEGQLPLALVRALGDDMAVPGCAESDTGRRLTVGEVLRALDTGESLVEIEDEQSTVRVWVE